MWLIAIVYALPMGFYGNWASFLDVILNPFGISQVWRQDCILEKSITVRYYDDIVIYHSFEAYS